MKFSLIAGTVAGLLALTAVPAHAAGPTVTVRVEGANATLLPRTQVTLGSDPVAACSGDPGNGAGTAAAAIDAATNGNWDDMPLTSTILGETHDFSNDDYWAEWIDTGSGYEFGGGICNDHLAGGNAVLMVADTSGPPPDYLPTALPLAVLGVPATATVGADLPVTVVAYTGATPGQAAKQPVAGATITGGDAPVTTDANGNATVHLGTAGTVALRATKAPDAPSASESIAVTTVAAAPGPRAPLAMPDRTPPTAKLAGITDHEVFKTGPRTLRGSFADASGVKTVKLRLTRRSGSRCSYFSGRSAKFRAARCGTSSYFAIGADASWSYLLPAKLAAGRYVLDAVAIDGAGNRTPLMRGSTRVVFTVR